MIAEALRRTQEIVSNLDDAKNWKEHAEDLQDLHISCWSCNWLNRQAAA